MRLRTTLCLSVFLLGLAPTVRGQAAAEFRDRPHDALGWPTQAVRASHGMIASDEELGSEAGVEILKRGGNAIDAAVAVAFALAVVEPAAGNIGGGGFMLVRLTDGRTTFLDYREVAPETYGTMKLAEVMGPAIRLAENGFAVSEKLAPQWQEHKAGLEKFPAS